MAKMVLFWCFGVQNGARRGHRIWTSYYCSKLVVFTPFTPRNGHFPPQTPKNHYFSDFHENDMKWVEFGEKGSPMVKIPWKYALYGKLSCVVHAKHLF